MTAAQRLWVVDQELAALWARQQELTAERNQLLAALGAADPFATPPPPTAAPRPVATAPVRESSPAQVQNTLLGLGALLLAVAGIVFAAVTYRRLGVTGRALVLLAVTAAATAAPFALRRRSLSSSAEAVGAVAVTLGLVDAWALRRAGLGGDTDVRTYWAVATAALAGITGYLSAPLPLLGWRISAVLLAQLPVLFGLARADAGLAATGMVLAGLGALDLLVVVTPRLPKLVRDTALVCTAIATVAGLVAGIGALHDGNRAGSLALVAVALVAAAGAVCATDSTHRALLAGAVVPLLAGAAWGASRSQLSHDQRPLVLLATALLGLQATGLLPAPHRRGPAVGALAVIGVALLTQVAAVLTALAGPFTWLGRAWSLHATEARAALTPHESWHGTVVSLIVVAAGAVCVLAAGLVLDEVSRAAPTAGVLLALSGLLLPLGLALTYHVSLVVLLGVAAALSAGGYLVPESFRAAVVWSGFSLGVIAAAWSTAEQDATLVVLPVVAALALVLCLPVLAKPTPALAGPAALLAGAELAAVGAAQGLSAPQVGGLLLVAPAVCAGLSFALRDTYRLVVETAGVLLLATCLVLAASDPGWLSWTLAAGGLLCLGVAVRPDRRTVGLAGGLLLSASSWVRLADAHVHAPEPYVLPLAAVAMVFGYLRRRADPAVGSFAAYGAGLSLALVPSLLRSLADHEPDRGLALVVACVVGLIVGGQLRLRAPLAICGGVLVVDALHLLAPFARALPRWSLLALAGTVLVGVGVTYEQRRRDLARLVERYETMS